MSYRRTYSGSNATGSARTSYRDPSWASKVGGAGFEERAGGYTRQFDPRSARGSDPSYGASSSSSSSSSNSPSLAVRLMQVAGEYELERKQEAKRLQSEVQSLKTKNESLQREKQSSERQVASLSRKLAQAQMETEQAQNEKNNDSETLRHEVLALRFALAETKSELQALKSHGGTEAPPRSSSTLDKDALQTVHGLQKAIDEEDKDKISRLCNEDALYSRTALCAAAKAGREDVCHYILSPKTVDSHSSTLKSSLNAALRSAAEEGRHRTVKQMIQLGASVNEVGDEDLMGRTPLHISCAKGHDNVVKILLSKADADVWKLDTVGNSCLHLASANNQPGIAKIMLLQGCNATSVNEDGFTPLQLAEHHRHTSVVEQLEDPDLRFWNASVRANKLYNLKDFQSAMDEYALALKYAPKCQARASPRDLATLYYNRARAAYRLAQHCQAIEDCNSALESDSTYRNALAQRAECYMALFEFEKASKDFDSLLESDPSDRQWERRKDDAEMMRDISYYSALGVSRSATNSQIKKAFRQQCLKWHPDKHTSSDEATRRATIVFTTINSAYETLADSYKRMMYDVDLRNKMLTQNASEGMGFEQWYEKEMQRENERAKERERALQSLRDKEQKEEEARKVRLSKLRKLRADRHNDTESKMNKEPVKVESSPSTPKRVESKRSMGEHKDESMEEEKPGVTEVPSYPSMPPQDERPSTSSTSTSPATTDSATENQPPDREIPRKGKQSQARESRSPPRASFGRDQNKEEETNDSSSTAMSQLLEALQSLGLPTDNLSTQDWDELSETAAAVAKEANQQEGGETGASVEQLLSAALQEGRAQLDRLGINIDEDDTYQGSTRSYTANSHEQPSSSQFFRGYRFSDESDDESTEADGDMSDITDDSDHELTFEEMNREFGSTFADSKTKASAREPAIPSDDVINKMASSYLNERRRVEEKMGAGVSESH
eukprot:gb/GECG01011985.1/.p1 GENE.gb/GECG01011985.1/~~gb/GECG01011985.1/.p1  ORF type:complete len:958 (+),score=185.21 gb/GECG01011985.1/:1-2874(+)